MGLTLRPTFLASPVSTNSSSLRHFTVGICRRSPSRLAYRQCLPALSDRSYDKLSSILAAYLGWRAPLPSRKSTNPPALSSGGVVLPICTSCSDNTARPALLWPVERRANVVAGVMGERPGSRAACRNNIGVIGAPTDDRQMTDGNVIQ
jgi:hypothetical protein